MTEQQLVIMNYALDARYPSETLRAYYPYTTDETGAIVADTSDPDDGSMAILLEPVSADGTGVDGSVRVLLPSGVRVVPSVAVGVYVIKSESE